MKWPRNDDDGTDYYDDDNDVADEWTSSSSC